MSADAQVAMLKVDLGLMRCTDQQEIYLRSLLTRAAGDISARGITLQPDCEEDETLAVMYAGWLYRARGSTEDKVLPKYLKQQLNNRLIHQKGRGT